MINYERNYGWYCMSVAFEDYFVWSVNGMYEGGVGHV